VQVQKIEDNTVREVTKAPVVDNQSLASVYHLHLVSIRCMEEAKLSYLDIVQILFLHGLELGNARRDAVQVMFHGIF
jgi:hypothetical protein